MGICCSNSRNILSFSRLRARGNHEHTRRLREDSLDDERQQQQQSNQILNSSRNKARSSSSFSSRNRQRRIRNSSFSSSSSSTSSSSTITSSYRPVQNFRVGDKVEALWLGKDRHIYPDWYPATVIRVSRNGFLGLHYDDGYRSWGVPPKAVRRLILDEPIMYTKEDMNEHRKDEEQVLPGSDLQAAIALSMGAEIEYDDNGKMRILSSSFDFTEKECVICMEAFDENPMVKTKCACGENKTLFHKECLHAWLKKSAACPVCKQKLHTGSDEKIER